MTPPTTQAQPQAQAMQAAPATAVSPSPTQVQRLARYAARASFDDLSPASRSQLSGLAGLLHRRPGRRPGECLPSAGGRLRGQRPLRTDRRRAGQPGLRGVLPHRPGALRRLHGQLPGPHRDLPHCRQFRCGTDGRRVCGRQRTRPHAWGGAGVYRAVTLRGPRQLHDPRLRPHGAARLLAQRCRWSTTRHARRADRPRHRRQQRRLVRRHPRQAAVAVEGPRLGAIGAGRHEHAVSGPARCAGATAGDRGPQRYRPPAGDADPHPVGDRRLRGGRHEHDQAVQRRDPRAIGHPLHARAGQAEQD